MSLMMRKKSIPMATDGSPHFEHQFSFHSNGMLRNLLIVNEVFSNLELKGALILQTGNLIFRTKFYSAAVEFLMLISKFDGGNHWLQLVIFCLGRSLASSNAKVVPQVASTEGQIAISCLPLSLAIISVLETDKD